MIRERLERGERPFRDRVAARMPLPTIIYYGESGLQGQVISTYFVHLGFTVRTAQDTHKLLTLVRRVHHPLVILSLNETPSFLMYLARLLIQDGTGAFPHVYILFEGDPFDAQLEGVTVTAGASRLSRLAEHLRAFLGSD